MGRSESNSGHHSRPHPERNLPGRRRSRRHPQRHSHPRLRYPDLTDALVATGFPYAIESHLADILDELAKILPVTQGVRRPGSAALDLAYTAAGRFDAFYEKALNPWDTAAGWLLVTEAGGTVTQYRPLNPYTLHAPTILASNGHLHVPMLDLLSRE